MAVSGIKSTNDAYTKLSSMKNINSAKDNAAGAAIVEGMKAAATQNKVIADGAATKQDMLRVTDGGLQSIANSLKRMRELSVQAGNATYTSDDRAGIQDEIEQLKQDITSVAGNTEFNTKKVLSGDSENNIALESLGIADYDVTSGSFDLSAIDNAIKTVNSQRSGIGAQSNSLDSTIAYNKLSHQNLTDAFSRVEDLDVGKAISDQKKEEVLDEYKNFAQQAKQDQQQKMVNLLNM